MIPGTMTMSIPATRASNRLHTSFRPYPVFRDEIRRTVSSQFVSVWLIRAARARQRILPGGGRFSPAVRRRRRRRRRRHRDGVVPDRTRR